jgi:hypothetical protein
VPIDYKARLVREAAHAGVITDSELHDFMAELDEYEDMYGMPGEGLGGGELCAFMMSVLICPRHLLIKATNVALHAHNDRINPTMVAMTWRQWQ